MKRNAFEARLGHCYELAGQYMMDLRIGGGPGATEGVKLVHGTIRGMGNPPIGHAWVDLGPFVYEPVTAEQYPADIFTQLFNALPEASYDYMQFRAMINAYQHWGPWHGEPPPKRRRRRR